MGMRSRGHGPASSDGPRHRSLWRAIALIAAAVLTAPALTAAEDCSAPLRPELPDGATASHDAMLAGQQAVRTFQKANMHYMKCLERAFEAAREPSSRPGMDEGERARARRAYDAATAAYNAAVSAEDEVAGRFNVELREYRAARR